MTRTYSQGNEFHDNKTEQNLKVVTMKNYQEYKYTKNYDIDINPYVES